VKYWSHHEKVVVVDNHRACIGGLDICFGRWDTQNQPLTDAHPTDFSRTIFPGQDFNNDRITDYHNVSDYVNENISVLESPRMPWQDVRFLRSESGPGSLVILLGTHDNQWPRCP
jgi:phospholipase D1/2